MKRRLSLGRPTSIFAAATSLLGAAILPAAGLGLTLPDGGLGAQRVGVAQVAVCHATAADANPYEYLLVADASVQLNGHEGHRTAPNKTWQADGSWNGIPHLAGDPKPDLIAPTDVFTESWCEAAIDLLVTTPPALTAAVSVSTFVASGAVAPTTPCGGTGWLPSVAVLTGAPLTWCVVVENTGTDALSAVAGLGELDVSTPTAGLPCTLPTTLAVGATGSCVYSGAAIVGAHTSYVGATATGATTATPVSAVVATASYTATDPVIVPPAVLVPGIGVSTSVASGAVAPATACGAAGWAPSVAVTTGDPVHWCVTVTNTGTDALTGVAGLAQLDVNPPTGSVPCTLPATLAVGASTSCVYSGVAVVGTHVSYAGATATGATVPTAVSAAVASASYTATDPVIVVGPGAGAGPVLPPIPGGGPAAGPPAAPAAPVLVPEITITIASDLATASVGDVIELTYVVTNTGTAPLSLVALHDDLLGNLTGSLPGRLLAPGDAVTVTATHTVGLADVPSIVHTATTWGFFDGAKVTATDAVTVPVSAVLGIVIDRPAAPAPEPQIEPRPAPAPPAEPAPVAAPVAEPAPAAAPAAAPAVQARELPRTGAPAGWLAVVAGLLIGVGAVALRRHPTVA